MMDSISTILKTVDLKVGYTGKQQVPVYCDINVDAGKGEMIAALGKNGIGKSTLLRTLARLQKPVNGRILLKDTDLNSYGRMELARLIGFVSTEIVQVSNMTLFDLVGLGRFPHTNWLGRLTKNDTQLIHEAIHLVGLDDLIHKNINEVSDGERQRAMIARTLAQDTEIIILDEPTAFLDLPNKYEIVHLLTELSRIKGKTVIFSTHDLNIAIQEADKIWLMLPDGIITGSPEDLVLESSFSPIFKNTKLQFDEQKGEIRMNRETGRKIHLTGEGITGLWTRRALERLGYSLTTKRECDTWIRVEINNDIPTWIIEKNSEISEFNSIYNLSLRLKHSY
jgi:iron complex transport system ATP-binding protein